ncbi:hypothetical protein FSARC_886 [Fusarium sarcochroum]|uniref:Uncharacterized protein n=1 Tax=Fusarium sarcochroum TaxID=1208366 RepID=A0A8H4UA09_9HYPO|nr:hypothetical protein FSARC_886 [Fusarium sarcochroum]
MTSQQSIDQDFETDEFAKRKHDMNISENRDDNKTNNPLVHSAKATKTSNGGEPNGGRDENGERMKAAQRLYNKTIKSIDRNIQTLDRKVQSSLGARWPYTTSDYAEHIPMHFKAVDTLTYLDLRLACNLLLSMADASHTDLNTDAKMCGSKDDESIPTFKKLDEALLPLIKARKKPESLVTELPEVPKRRNDRFENSSEYDDLPIINEPGQLLHEPLWNEYLICEKVRREARRQRREDIDDWVTVALNDLKEDKDYLMEYGLRVYLPNSIAKLEEIRKEIQTG